MRAISTVSLLTLVALVGCATSDAAAPEADFSWTERGTNNLAVDLLLETPAVNSSNSAILTVTGANPGETLSFLRGSGALGDGPCAPQIGDQCVDLIGGVSLLGTAVADQAGVATFTADLSNDSIGDERAFQAAAIRGSGGADSVASNPARVRKNDNSTRFRVLHASPDAPDVDIYANGGLLLPGVPFGAQSGWLDVPAGSYTIDIRAAGADPASTPVISATLGLGADQTYTVAAAGFLTSTDPADSFRLLPLVEDFETIDPAGIRARLIHASPDAPTVAIDVGNDGTLDIPSFDRFADSDMLVPGGVPLPANTELAVGIALPTGAPVTSFTIPALAPGEEAIIFAFGTLASHPNGEAGFSAYALLRDGTFARIKQDPVVYALHASPGAPAVDVLAGGATLIDDLAFREISEPVRVPPGAYTLDITTFDGAPVDTWTTPTLMAGGQYLVTATGFVGGTPAFQPIITADEFPPDAPEARIAVVHASPDAPPVDIGLGFGSSFNGVLLDVPFGLQAAGRGIRVNPGTYDLGVGVSPATSSTFDFPGIPVMMGDRNIYVANGELAAGDFGITWVDAAASPWTAVTVFPN